MSTPAGAGRRATSDRVWAPFEPKCTFVRLLVPAADFSAPRPDRFVARFETMAAESCSNCNVLIPRAREL